MIKKEDIHIRDPFIVPVAEEKKCYMYGTTDPDPWESGGVGFDCYTSRDLQQWEGPFPVFRPEEDFWAERNFWAPEVHEYEGKYYMFASFKADGVCRGTQILIADNLKGPFTPHSDGPVTPDDWECLDGTLYVDRDDHPWMVFCHEWVQVHDGEICAVKLTDDLRASVDEPRLLFTASEAPWTAPLSINNEKNGKEQEEQNEENYVTDGPFVFHNKKYELCMLWSSFVSDGYAMGIARSTSGDISGPWVHDEKPLYSKDGGHGMLFKTFDNKLMLTFHTPNKSPDERPVFVEVHEKEDGTLGVN